MAQLCKRGRDWIQVFNSDGMVRICGWTGTDGWIGSLLDHSLSEIYHGKRAEKFRRALLNQDYSSCSVDDCPLLMTGEIAKFQKELGTLPDYPEELYIAFENTCNYRCTSCTVCGMDFGKDKKEIESHYEVIEKRIREALPHAKIIGANGLGELFASKRTLKLLSEWNPIAPAEECQVWLETNGSLFDEEHWKEIENLGKYYLRVAITIMSFDEATYQRLSRVKYPIERIENNLRFIKSLREKNIINHIELATVVQAENFRTLPVFAHRCIEEFGADTVRLRPYTNWGAQNEIEEFFTDIRNPKHPWYQEYREVLKHPYLSHPKVREQSGGNDSYNTKTVPYELSDLKWKILTYILDDSDKVIEAITQFGDFVLYGNGNITASLIHKLKEKGILPIAVLDSQKKSGEIEGIPVYNVKEAENLKGKDYTVIITPIRNVTGIKKMLVEQGLCKEAVPIWDCIDREEIKERLRYINNIL